MATPESRHARDLSSEALAKEEGGHPICFEFESGGAIVAGRYWVYMVTDKPYGTLYVGVTSNLHRRCYEHREKLYEGFTKKYCLDKLVYYEEYPTAIEAISREKQIKKWNRAWKINDLIHRQNREWRDLYDDLNK